MIGRTELPPHRDLHGLRCNPGQPGRVPHVAGEYVRRCRRCHTTFIAVVSVAIHATQKCGREVLRLDWLAADREPVS